MEHSKRQHVIALARQTGVLRPRDLAERALPPEYLPQLARQGILARIGRGLYRLADGEPGEHQSLLEACARVPHGVLCLLTALRYHELTTQAPAEIWMALAEHARHPAAPEIPLHIVRLSGDVFTTGMEEHLVDGVTIRVYGLEKTIADCVKYRNKIGIDVALEALREGWRTRRIHMDALWRYAKIDRVTNVMRPYLEMLAAYRDHPVSCLLPSVAETPPEMTFAPHACVGGANVISGGNTVQQSSTTNVARASRP